MTGRRHAIITAFVALFLLQASITMYGGLGSEGSDMPVRIILVVVSGIADIVIAYNVLKRLRQIERNVTSEVARQLDESLEAYHERAAHADRISLQLARDVDDQLALAQQALASGDIASVEEHLRTSKELASQALAPHCDNAMASAILASKEEQCREANIALRTQVTLPETLPVEETDIAAILLDLIDNALHEFQKLIQLGTMPDQPYIEVRSRLQTGQFFAEVVGPCLPGDDTSRRRHMLIHQSIFNPQLGPNIAFSITSQHRGIRSYEKREGVLSVSVMFPLPTA